MNSPFYVLDIIQTFGECLAVQCSFTTVTEGSLRRKKNPEKFGLLDQTGGGLTESQLFVKFFKNQICLGTVHKCDETHTTQMGRQYLINS